MAKFLISQYGGTDLSACFSQSRWPWFVRLNQQVPQQSEPPFGIAQTAVFGRAATNALAAETKATLRGEYVAIFSRSRMSAWSGRPSSLSCNHLKQLVDELNLSPNIRTAHPLGLPLPDHSQWLLPARSASVLFPSPPGARSLCVPRDLLARLRITRLKSLPFYRFSR